MSKLIRDVLKKKGDSVLSISADATVYQALELMATEDVGALLVVEDERVIGLISEREYARKVILEGRSSLNTDVKQIMLSKVPYISPEMTVEEGLALMTDKRCRHLPVFEDNKLVGLVSIGDLVKGQVAEKEYFIHQLEDYIHGATNT